MTKLLIKYQDKYICSKNNNKIDFIHIPSYHPKGDYFSNISVFIILISNGYLNYDYSSSVYLKDYEWSELFEEYFLPEYLFQVDEETYIYDLDKLLKDYPDYIDHYNNVLSNLPINIIIKPHTELINITQEDTFDEEIPYTWNYQTTHVSKELELFIRKRHKERTNKDVLLMYSGGKDSTLAAIRLHNEGYNVHFIHFDNGHMRDQDKPYLTFKKTFQDKEGYFFDYELSEVNIKDLFETYYSNWNHTLTDPLLTSEIRCLSCRMAMYTTLIRIAKKEGFKYIAEGARISQKFMLEQIPIIERLTKLAQSNGIELLLPVLHLYDDEKEKQELLDNGYSSKTWESKCLIGKPPKDKTEQDEKIILDYYEKELIPKLLKQI